MFHDFSVRSFATRAIRWDTSDAMDEALNDGPWIDMNSINISWEMKVTKGRHDLNFHCFL